MCDVIILRTLNVKLQTLSFEHRMPLRLLTYIFFSAKVKAELTRKAPFKVPSLKGAFLFRPLFYIPAYSLVHPGRIFDYRPPYLTGANKIAG
jgi:hypothetical protein